MGMYEAIYATCRVCGVPLPRWWGPRYICCSGWECGCGGGYLPHSVCSTSCYENEDRLPPLELLEDDESLAELAESVRADRIAKGLNPDTGLPLQPNERP